MLQRSAERLEIKLRRENDNFVPGKLWGVISIWGALLYGSSEKSEIQARIILHDSINFEHRGAADSDQCFTMKRVEGLLSRSGAHAARYLSMRCAPGLYLAQGLQSAPYGRVRAFTRLLTRHAS